MPFTTLKSVVLPAPFGPITPWIWPRSTASETPSSTTMPPKRLTSASTARIGSATAAAIRGDGPRSAPGARSRFEPGRRLELGRGVLDGQITLALPSMSWTIGKKKPFMNGADHRPRPAPSAFSPASVGNLYSVPDPL